MNFFGEKPGESDFWKTLSSRAELAGENGGEIRWHFLSSVFYLLVSFRYTTIIMWWRLKIQIYCLRLLSCADSRALRVRETQAVARHEAQYAPRRIRERLAFRLSLLFFEANI